MCTLILFFLAFFGPETLGVPVPGILGTPMFIRSGIVNNGAQFEDASNSALSQQKALTNFDGDENYSKLFQKKLLDAALNSRYGEQSNVANNHLDSNNYNKGMMANSNGAEGANIENKQFNKKGHHKQGFHNSYHKDEVGSNSSFFDDGESEGGQQVFKNNQDSYANNQQGNQRGDHTNMATYNNQKGDQGHFVKGDNYDYDANNQQNHNRNHYYNDRSDANLRNTGRRYGDEANYNQESYGNNQHFLPPHQMEGPPQMGMPTRRKITIFEDPRYDVPSNHYRGDYVELDVRPARQRDFVRPPPYDYY